jgi:hypothetical protein
VKNVRLTPELCQLSWCCLQHHLVRGGFPSHSSTVSMALEHQGLDDSRLCSWVLPIAEVDERHVARKLR